MLFVKFMNIWLVKKTNLDFFSNLLIPVWFLFLNGKRVICELFLEIDEKVLTFLVESKIDFFKLDFEHFAQNSKEWVSSEERN